MKQFLIVLAVFLAMGLLGYFGYENKQDATKVIAQAPPTHKDITQVIKDYRTDIDYQTLLFEVEYNPYVAYVLYVNSDAADEVFLQEIRNFDIQTLGKWEVYEVLDRLGWVNTKSMMKEVF